MNIIALLTRFRDWIILLVLLLFSVALMNSSPHPAAQVFRQGVSSVVVVFAAPFVFIPNAITLWHENAALREEVMELHDREEQWRDAFLENARLRQLLGFRERPDHSYLAAEVVARDATPGLIAYILDKGNADSVLVGNAVVTDAGLVGKVIETQRHQCRAQLATDRNFAVSARDERSRVDGIIRWRSGYTLEMDDVPRNLDIRIGDRIVTSGLGGLIPEGIPIGVVSEISTERSELFLRIEVQPFVAFARLEEVFILVMEDYAEEE